MSDERFVVSAAPRVILFMHTAELARFSTWLVADELVFRTQVLTDLGLRELCSQIMPDYTVPPAPSEQTLISIAGLLNQKLLQGVRIVQPSGLSLPVLRVEILRL